MSQTHECEGLRYTDPHILSITLIPLLGKTIRKIYAVRPRDIGLIEGTCLGVLPSCELIIGSRNISCLIHSLIELRIR